MPRGDEIHPHGDGFESHSDESGKAKELIPHGEEARLRRLEP
jgi:hypothetical protein